MRLGDTVVSVMQQRTCKMPIISAMDGSAGSDSGSEQVRADGDADGESGGIGDDALDSGIAHGRAAIGRKPQG